MVYKSAVMSHIGCKRKNNQDNYYLNGVCRRDVQQDIFEFVEHQERHGVIAGVFDGAGGAQHGEIASLLAVTSMEQYGQDMSLDTVLQEYIPAVNTKIVKEAQKTDGVMATTMALLLLDGGMASVCNLGDSRVYLYRNQRLMQLTYDHTQAQIIQEKMADSPEGLYMEEFHCVQQKHILTRYLGMEKESNLQPYFMKNIPVAEGDIFVLCSDGLFNMLPQPELSEYIEKKKQSMPEEIAHFLIEKALLSGGNDNVTCMVIKAFHKRNQ